MNRFVVSVKQYICLKGGVANITHEPAFLLFISDQPLETVLLQWRNLEVAALVGLCFSMNWTNVVFKVGVRCCYKEAGSTLERLSLSVNLPNVCHNRGHVACRELAFTFVRFKSFMLAFYVNCKWILVSKFFSTSVTFKGLLLWHSMGVFDVRSEIASIYRWKLALAALVGVHCFMIRFKMCREAPDGW